MQRADLDVAAQLFDLATDGVEEQVWSKRFQDHIASTMRKHSSNLRAKSGSDVRLEVFRARMELHEIVHDRVEARAMRTDPQLADVLRALREANSSMGQEILAAAMEHQAAASGRDVSVMDGDVRSTSSGRALDGGQHAGAGAFAAAASSRARGPSAAGIGGWESPRGSPTEVWMSPRQGAPQSPQDGLAVAAMPHRGTRPNGYAAIHGGRDAPANVSAKNASRPGKELSLRQLRHVMNSVYMSKQHRDARCQELREPVDTMEQHLYAWLTKRYGLKLVVQEWAQAIYRSIQRYAAREVDVRVFGKILQNTLAESFAITQDTLKNTVQMLLRQNLQQRHSGRPAGEIEALWRVRARVGVPLTEAEEVVRYMYNEQDSEEVLSRLTEQAEASALSKDLGVDPDTINFRDLLRMLLTFQVQLTEQFLSEFVELFNDVDADEDGVVNGRELQSILERLGQFEDDQTPQQAPDATASLIEAQESIGPIVQSMTRATFSECVDLFTSIITARWAVFHANS